MRAVGVKGAMAKADLELVRYLERGDEGRDVIAIKRMISRAGVDFELVRDKRGRIDDHFGKKLEDAVKRFQRKNGLVDDGEVGYMTFKPLVKLADARDSQLLRQAVKELIGDWGILGRPTAFNGIDMGVDFAGAGPIPMFADGEIVRLVRKDSGWPGIGGLIVVQCDKGPMARHPIYTAEDISIPSSHRVGKRLMKGELLADASLLDGRVVVIGIRDMAEQTRDRGDDADRLVVGAGHLRRDHGPESVRSLAARLVLASTSEHAP